MSVEKIVAMAMENNPLKLKEAFEEEMVSRISVALEEKAAKASAKMDEEEGEKEVCSHCEGKGYHMDGDKKVECPQCEGTGYMPDEKAENIKESADEDEEDDEDEADDSDDDEDEDDDEEAVAEMKKLHASKKYSKMEMYKKMSEKYGMTKKKFEGLYASNCGG